MGDKTKDARERPQLDEPPSNGQSNMMRSPRTTRLLPRLRTHVTPLQIPFGLQYLGSSPQKHIKGNRANLAVSARGTIGVIETVSEAIPKSARAPLRRPPGTLTSRSTILASATAAATLPSQTSDNNNKHNAIVRITRTAPSPPPEPTSKRARTMEGFQLFNERTPSAEPQEQGLPSFQSFLNQNSSSSAQWTPDAGIDPHTIAVSVPLSRYEISRLQNEVQLLRSNGELQEQEIHRFRAYIAELAGFNENIHKYLGSLHNRLQVLEGDNARYREMFGDLDDDDYSRSPTVSRVRMSTTYRNNGVNRARSLSPEPHGSFVYMAPGDRDAFDGTEEAGDVEAQTMQTALNGLPTPTYTNGPPTATSFNFSRPPLITSSQPQISAATGARKPTTMLAKRNVHNLSKTMVPSTTQLPQMALTNVEVIVYFFNSISRPMVALRLYAQNEGPASITAILNDHRNTKPPYLRNTCSVKCVTAIRRGKELYGPEWEDKYRTLFEDAMEMENKVTGLLTATELIRIPEVESEDATDIDILELLNGLSKHPQQDEGRGWFTACVEYCEENRLHWPLSEIHVLATELHAGRRPQAYGEHSDDDMEIEIQGHHVVPGVKRELAGSQEVAIETEKDSVIEVSDTDTDADTIIDNEFFAGYIPGGKENGAPDQVEEYDAADEEV